MALPTTLLELATQNRDAAKARDTAARLALLTSGTDLTAASNDLAAAMAELSALDKQAAAIRDALSKVATPADGEALLLELEQQIIAFRHKQAEVLNLEQRRDEEQSARDAAAGELAGAGATLAKAEADLIAASSEDKKRQTWKTAIAAAPLSGLRAAATAVLTTAPANQPFADAKARIDADIPAALLVRAQTRRTQASVPLTNAAARLSGAEDLSDGKLGARFRRAEGAVQDYAALAKGRFDRALTLLLRVADPKNSPLTDEQKARINDAALVADGTAAAAKEKDRDDAQAALDAKQLALDEAILNAQVSDIDADPAADAAVQAATIDRDTAQTAFDTAVAAYTSAMQNDLDTWEAAVPDTAWRLLDDFEEATALLKWLDATDPNALAGAMASAETAWVAGLLVAGKKARTAAFLAVEMAAGAANLVFEKSAAPRRKFGALRGDN